MHARKIVLMAIVCALLTAVGASQALAQQDRRGPRADREDRDPAAMRERMEAMRERAADRLQQQLGIEDEAEWQLLRPKIERVQNLAQQVAGGRGMMAAAGRGRRRAEVDAEEDPSPVLQATQKLRETLEDENATAQQIADALSGLREAREKARQELTKAQEELRELLQQEQEARLVLMGILE